MPTDGVAYSRKEIFIAQNSSEERLKRQQYKLLSGLGKMGRSMCFITDFIYADVMGSLRIEYNILKNAGHMLHALMGQLFLKVRR